MNHKGFASKKTPYLRIRIIHIHAFYTHFLTIYYITAQNYTNKPHFNHACFQSRISKSINPRNEIEKKQPFCKHFALPFKGISPSFKTNEASLYDQRAVPPRETRLFACPINAYILQNHPFIVPERYKYAIFYAVSFLFRSFLYFSVSSKQPNYLNFNNNIVKTALLIIVRILLISKLPNRLSAYIPSLLFLLPLI